ncbi:MAG: hypothetical protein CM15mP126_7440 [Gammaproteobacteria bacterium]|nr:MAG: hypothetical protein CM15mP126_7440 [Gammaproteobacteria bacterium]
MSNSSAFYFDMVDDKDLDNVVFLGVDMQITKICGQLMFLIFLMTHMELKNNISKEYIESSEKLKSLIEIILLEFSLKFGAKQSEMRISSIICSCQTL